MKIIRKLANLDKPTAHTLMFRLWSVLVGVANLAIIPFSLSPTEQGYYYTYGSILALQVFFELGLNQVISQFASHEAAHFDIRAEVPSKYELQHFRLVSLIKMMRRWYGAMAMAFALLIGAGGILFFERNGALSSNSWIYSWLALVIASSINLYLSPWLAFLEGCGRMADIARLRFAQSIIGSLLMWAVLVNGGGLNAIPFVPLAACVFTWLWLRKNDRYIARAHTVSVPPGVGIDWKVEVFPLQWRISLSWMSGYLIFNLVTPLAFVRAGAVEAGQLGMSFAIFNSITSIGMSWVNARAPQLSMHASKEEYGQMNALFWRSLSSSLSAIAIASVVFILCAFVFGGFLPQIAQRIAPAPTLWFLAIAATCNCAIFSGATYMRSFKKEPMLTNSIVTGCISAFVMFTTSKYGPSAMMAGYCFVIATICLPWTAVLFKKFYRKSSLAN